MSINQFIKFKQMKRTITSAFFVLFSLIVFGQYVTPGTGVSWSLDDLVQNSSGVVTFEDDAYYLWEDIIVSENDTVKILIDGILRISTEKLVTVAGTLLVDPPGNFTFTAVDTTQNFLGFRFEDSDNSYLRKCTVEFGGGIKLINSDLTIEDCIIRKNNKSNSSGAIDIFQSNPTIKNCEISINAGPAIMSAANSGSSPTVTGNIVYHNNTANENMPQLNFGTTSESAELQIIDNVIEGFYDNVGGIAVSTLAGGSVLCKIQGNIISNSRYGIAVYGNNISSEIRDNIISDNNIQNDPMLGGSGINFWGDTTNISLVTGNEISGNLWGVTIQNKARPNLGQLGEDTVNIGKNLIYNNGNNGTVYALYNNTPGDIYAENNYWGTFNLDSVEMYIFHQPDDPSLGFVDYLPIKDYLTGIDVGKSDLKLIDAFYPNPVSTAGTIVFSKISKKKLKKITVYNTSGNILFSIETLKGKYKLNTRNLRAGLYLIKIESGGVSGFYKFIKK
jgi:parallel beta-helix repeat protein